MVDVQKLRSRMVLMGYNQKSLAAEMTARGVKISENTLSAKMTGGSKFDTDDADVICEILELVEPADKAAIFLA
jgi:hypothetical protein